MSDAGGGSRERFFELSANLLAIAGPDGRILDVNPAWERLLGPPRARPLGDFAHPEDRAEIEALWTRAERQGDDEPTVWSVNRFGSGDGEDLWLSWSLSRPAGDTTHLHVMARDVSETGGDVAGGRAIAARDRLVALVENSRDFIAVATLEGRVYFVNSCGRELVGLPAEGDVPEDIRVYLPAEARRRLTEEAFPAVLAEDRWAGTAQFQDFRDPDAVIDVDISLFLVRERGSGTPLCIATIARDATERLRAERSERRLEIAQQLQNRAVQLNDDVVQGLIVAKLAYERGDGELAAASVERTLDAARAIVADLLAAAMPAEGYGPGDLVRTRPADV